MVGYRQEEMSRREGVGRWPTAENALEIDFLGTAAFRLPSFPQRFAIFCDKE